MNTKKAIIILGAPGSGKGTQGNLLEKNIQYKKYVMSNLIKSELDLKEDSNKNWAKTYNVESGILLEDKDIFELFKENFKFEDNIILDGIPRTEDQAYWLYGFLKEHCYKIIVIFLDVDEDKLLQRILIRAKKQNRADDTPQIFKERIKIYDKTKRIILNVYKENIIKINGDRKIDLIQKNILDKLKN